MENIITHTYVERHTSNVVRSRPNRPSVRPEKRPERPTRMIEAPSFRNVKMSQTKGFTSSSSTHLVPLLAVSAVLWRREVVKVGESSIEVVVVVMIEFL